MLFRSLQLVNSEHYYTTDFFQESAVNPEDQLISIYYKITLADLAQLNVSLTKFDFKEISEEMISLRWIPLSDISASDFTFPVDKHVAELLKYDFEKN